MPDEKMVKVKIGRVKDKMFYTVNDSGTTYREITQEKFDEYQLLSKQYEEMRSYLSKVFWDGYKGVSID